VTDLAFTFITSFLYYLDYNSLDEDTRSLYRQGISTFGGISPTYRIALKKDAPVIVWKLSFYGNICCRILQKPVIMIELYLGVTKTGSGSPFAK